MISFLYAQGANQPAPSSGLNMLWPILLMFLIFYFLIIRPQSKRQKELEKKRKGIAKGDKLVTSGGMICKVTSAKEEQDFVTVEIAANVRVDIMRSAIISVSSFNNEQKSNRKISQNTDKTKQKKK